MTRLAHHHLRGTCAFEVLLDAIELAAFRPDAQTADLLYEVALREEVEGQRYAMTPLFPTLRGRRQLPCLESVAWTWPSAEL